MSELKMHAVPCRPPLQKNPFHLGNEISRVEENGESFSPVSPPPTHLKCFHLRAKFRPSYVVESILEIQVENVPTFQEQWFFEIWSTWKAGRRGLHKGYQVNWMGFQYEQYNLQICFMDWEHFHQKLCFICTKNTFFSPLKFSNGISKNATELETEFL